MKKPGRHFSPLLAVVLLLCILMPTPVRAATSTVTFVVAGGAFACALKSDQTVWCWGKNDQGQLGNGTTTDSATPKLVQNLPPVTTLEAGSEHTCAVTSTKDLYCWGYNFSSQLGYKPGNDQGSKYSSRPRRVTLSGVLQVSAGGTHTCAVTSGGAFCWGAGSWGQLGNGSTASKDTPTKVVINTAVTSITAGSGVTCALSSAKDVWCWGFNANGSVGIGKADTADHFTPKPIPNFKNVSLVRATSLTVCAVKTDATAWCWGRNNWGQVGTGGLGSAPKPTRVATKVKEVRPGGSGGPVGAFTGHTCFVYTNRSIGCAGDNSEGQLGRTTKLFFSPDIAQVGGLTAVTNASAGGAFTCAVKAGAAWCWGSDKYGQLGDGTAGSSRRTPARVALP